MIKSIFWTFLSLAGVAAVFIGAIAFDAATSAGVIEHGSWKAAGIFISLFVAMKVLSVVALIVVAEAVIEVRRGFRWPRAALVLCVFGAVFVTGCSDEGEPKRFSVWSAYTIGGMDGFESYLMREWSHEGYKKGVVLITFPRTNEAPTPACGQFRERVFTMRSADIALAEIYKYDAALLQMIDPTAPACVAYSVRVSRDGISMVRMPLDVTEGNMP